MNTFAEKRQARIARLRERAAKKRAEADEIDARDAALAACIPMGQPILVGHYSERRHRRDLARMRRNVTKSLALRDEARELERRAEAAESTCTVFSDDPEAIEKLKAKLAAINAEREEAKRINKAVRSKDPRGSLAALGYSEEQIAKFLTRDPFGNIGVPSSRISNLAAEAKRIEKRIAELEARRAASPEAEQIGDVEIREEDNRVRVLFPYKPAEEVRALLKRAGFRWSPSAGAWQRHASEAAWAKAREIARQVAR